MHPDYIPEFFATNGNDIAIIRFSSQMFDIVDMTIQVGGAREGPSFVLKI
jgi:hypothetical protein